MNIKYAVKYRHLLSDTLQTTHEFLYLEAYDLIEQELDKLRQFEGRVYCI
jgi:hypothetical protein